MMPNRITTVLVAFFLVINSGPTFAVFLAPWCQIHNAPDGCLCHRKMGWGICDRKAGECPTLPFGYKGVIYVNPKDQWATNPPPGPTIIKNNACPLLSK